ncbi:glutathione S-transferase [Raphidocelis subcapitata]|uniref:Glutathione S-transferase n=1 Tax=Raphidocelis subcapitata TaxID=307507 RepID=A0A2V0PEN5_9CHLO|nr:glutathione S-transferase [Raphidocelis subcapitata]|eukprot:GBF97979.1 glutathione S-transferase [Raphidocelis subcapitata]
MASGSLPRPAPAGRAVAGSAFNTRAAPTSVSGVVAARRAAACRAAGAHAAAAAAPALPKVSKPTLFDMPVSNNGARVRHVIYSKGLEGEFDIVPPSTVGGLASDTYKALNPQGKMPLLLLPDGTAIPESEVIVGYILDRWASSGPSLRAATPELRAKAALAARVHDLYITTVQACMYRAMPAAERARGIAQIARQLDVLEGICEGPYLAGEVTSADSAVFPTVVFMMQMLPDVFGWADVFAGRPKLAAWWQALQRDPAAVRVE